MNGFCFNICGLKDNRMFIDGGMDYWTGEGLCLFMFTVVDRVFGHISYRSDWELVKVDFRQSFPRQCTEADYDSWKLTDLQVTSGCFL